MKVGVVLPTTPGPDGVIPVRSAARYAEALGLDSVWVGDHLVVGRPALEASVVVATAAAATRQVTVGIAVFVPALRPLAWAAKQVGSLAHLISGRFVLGIGSGGPGPEWDAVGVPARERGRRTDRALSRLPGLLAGRPTLIHDDPRLPPLRLEPAVPMPPVWIGGNSALARRRAATYGDAWFPSLATTAEVADGRRHLHRLAGERGRPVPGIVVGAAAALGADSDRAAIVARSLTESYGLPPHRAAALPIVGDAPSVAERFVAYTRAGAGHLVIGVAGDWRRGYEVLAEARRLL